MSNIIKNHLSKSVVITGASVAGKTTLCRRLMTHFCLEPLPVQMTRKSRGGEVENVDGVFIVEEEFKLRFSKGCYMQKSLESAYFSGSYYGCPRKWVSSIESGNYHCFVCPTVKMAKEIKDLLGKKIFWVHLVANSAVRRQRLMQRNPDMKKEDFESRIARGSASIDVSGNDLVIDTSYLNAWEIFFHALARI